MLYYDVRDRQITSAFVGRYSEDKCESVIQRKMDENVNYGGSSRENQAERLIPPFTLLYNNSIEGKLQSPKISNILLLKI